MNTEATPTPTPTVKSLETIGNNLVDSATQAIQPWVPLLIALAVIALAIAITAPWLINRYIIWKEVYGYSRLEAFCAPFKAIYRGIYKLIKKEPAPRPYRVTQPRELLKAKEELMKHPSVKSALTAKDEESLWLVKRGTVTKNIYEGSMWDGTSKITGTKEVPKSYRFDFSTFLSPYPKTVKDLTRATRNKYNSEEYRYLPRVQARIMADRLIIRKATDIEALGLIQPEDADYKYGFFIIEIYANHSTPEDILKLEPAIKAALKLEKLKQREVTSNRVTWLALMPGVKTPLENASMPTGEEFVRANPANESLTRIPLAVSATGKPWVLVPHHTLLVGKSGAGKSSLLNMVCAQLSDAVLEGRAELYGIDPKVDGEIRTQWGRTNFFKDEANIKQIDKWVTIIDRFYELMESKDVDDSKFTKATLSADALKQNTFKASKKTPLRILFIEELPSFMGIINKHPEGKQTVDKLNQILRKGRSSGHFIFSAAQNIERGKLEPLDPKGFINKLPLALNDSSYLLNLMLGDGAAERGYDTRKFNPKDNPEHRGLGYAVGEDGEPVMIRFPYFDEAQLKAILDKHTPDEEEAPTATNTGTVELIQEQVAPEALEFDLDDIDTL